MKTKPSWTATNEAGAKLYYYDGLGWIDSSTGLVVEMDLKDVVTRPADATHVQIHGGQTAWVKRTAGGDNCLQGDRGDWIACGLQLSGTVVRLSDGYVSNKAGHGAWVEIQRKDGKCFKHQADQIEWDWSQRKQRNADHVLWWRYAEDKRLPADFTPWPGKGTVLNDLSLVTVMFRDGGQKTARVGDLNWERSRNQPHGDIVGWKYA